MKEIGRIERPDGLSSDFTNSFNNIDIIIIIIIIRNSVFEIFEPIGALEGSEGTEPSSRQDYIQHLQRVPLHWILIEP